MEIKLIVGTDIGLRENNEDNFTASADLSQEGWTIPVDAASVYAPGELGCLMAVADGMGGQNAGEVASAIAVQTVQECFSAGQLPDGIVGDATRICSYLKEVVRKADRRVKTHSAAHAESQGMGSTLVLAWLVGNSAYVAWIGDSRAYSYVPGKGIARLSKDHSYVQQLVDEKRLSEADAMTHPDSNIITRSLGDPSSEARADVVSKTLEEGEIIMLCSDGLCGVCPDEQIGSIIESMPDDLSVCKDKLMASALSAGGTDNITIALARVVSLSAVARPARRRFSVGRVLGALLALLLFLVLGFAGYRLFFGKNRQADNFNTTATDTAAFVTFVEDTTPVVEKPDTGHDTLATDSSHSTNNTLNPSGSEHNGSGSFSDGDGTTLSWPSKIGTGQSGSGGMNEATTDGAVKKNLPVK